MSLLLLSTQQDNAAQRLQWMIEAVSPQEPLEVIHSVEMLSRRLRQPGRGLRMAVIRVTTHEELQQIVPLADLFTDLATVLLLPDAAAETVAQAHRLRPRFLAYEDSDPAMIAAVLAKMLNSRSGVGEPRERKGQISRKGRKTRAKVCPE